MSRLFSFFKSTSRLLTIPRLFTAENSEKYFETHIIKILSNRFPNAQLVKVDDISGGCGAMFKIVVETSEFEGNSIINQHKMITEALKKEIKDMHGLTIETLIPKPKVQ